jgi:hypothetical protein
LSVLTQKLSLSVSQHFYLLVFGKVGFFWLKLRILVGNTQTKTIFKKMEKLDVSDAFAYTGCTRSFKLQQIMILQTHVDDKRNGEFFVFFQQKQ